MTHDPPRCYFCEGYVQLKKTHSGGPGMLCGRCNQATHFTCLDKRELVGETGGGFLGSSTTWGKCPNCQCEQEIDWNLP